MHKLPNVKLIFLLNIIVFQFLAGYQNIFAQEPNIEYTYKHYTIRDGLNQMQVMSLCLDKKGYLWCSTKVGLSRFDGKSFKNITNANIDLNNFDIQTLSENSRGDLFLFSQHGLSRVKENTIELISYPDNCTGISYYEKSGVAGLMDMYYTGDSTNSTGMILNYEDPDSLYLVKYSFSRGRIIYFDNRDQNLVWQTDFDSIYVTNIVNDNVVKSYVNPGHISKLVANKECIYGITDSAAIYKLIDDEFELVVETNLYDRYFTAIPTPDNEAFIFKTTTDLYYYKDKLIPIKKNLTFIRDILFDNEDNLWVATEEGLYNFFQLNFTNYSFGMGNKDWVWSVIEDNNHNMWFSSYQNGIWKWDGNSVTNYTEVLNNEIKNHVKTAVKPAFYRYYMGASKTGAEIYFPTECNVLKYEDEKFSPLQGLPNEPFQITKILPDGTLACGGYPGLFILKNEKVIKYWHRDSLKVSSVLNVETDKRNHLVVVGKAGVSVIKNDSVVNYNYDNCLRSYSTAKDHKDNIWIAGIENINLYDGDSLVHVTKKSEEAFYSLLFVEPHYLLLGGLKGIYVANLEDYYQNGTFEMLLFDQQSGFTGIECGQNGFFTDSNGMVWIPTSDYVTRFNPVNLINKKVTPPKIYLNGEVSFDNIDWIDLSKKEKRKLKFSSNNVRFRIDAVSFANIGNIRLYYKLTGVQEKWLETSDLGEITFYHLGPGEYSFYAKADAGISLATSETKIISFEIEKPIWLKLWFILTVIVLIHVIIWIVILYFKRAALKKAAIQQRIVQLRSEALAVQLDPHFVMNCLNNISGLINMDKKSMANDYIVKFSKLLRTILRSVKKETVSLGDELEMVENYIQLELLRCNNCFTYKINLPEKYSVQNILVPPMILQPIVENSIKHGFENGKWVNAKLEMKVEILDKDLIITVSDNGKGMQDNALPLGTGLGTKITRERIYLLQKKNNVEFNIKNKVQGVEVSIKIPLILKM